MPESLLLALVGPFVLAAGLMALFAAVDHYDARAARAVIAHTPPGWFDTAGTVPPLIEIQERAL